MVEDQNYKGNLHSSWQMEPDIESIRNCVIQEIVNILRRQPHATEVGPRLPDVARRLEQALFKNASSKEEYMDTSTLQRKLADFMSRISSSNHSQQLRLRNYNSSSSSIGTMTPTPGMPQSGNANSSVSSVGNSMVVSSSVTGLPTDPSSVSADEADDDTVVLGRNDSGSTEPEDNKTDDQAIGGGVGGLAQVEHRQREKDLQGAQEKGSTTGLDQSTQSPV